MCLWLSESVFRSLESEKKVIFSSKTGPFYTAAGSDGIDKVHLRDRTGQDRTGQDKTDI